MIATPVVETTCVCGATVAVVETDGKPGVMHGLPMCSGFESREPIEYLHWLNNHIETQNRS